MKTLLVMLSCLSLAACAVGYNPRYYYSNIEVANLSGGAITNVEVQIGADGRNLRCESVAKNALCQERFGKRPYPQQDIQLTWQDSDGNPQSATMNPDIPVTLTQSWSLRIMLDIQEDGSVKAYFKQDEARLGALDISSKPAG
jgi:hypothetical protein